MGFSVVIDETGVDVYAQWDGATEQVLVLTPLLNVTLELKCLHPAPDKLTITVVDDAGNVGLIGALPGAAIKSDDLKDDIEQLQVVYRP